jgi:RNA polymerase sigma-70 factor (ECF subfamily)
MPWTADRDSFDRLMLEHLQIAQRFAVRITGDADAAEDVVQNALVRAARSWQTFRGQSSFSTWLLRIVLNAAHDRRAAAARRDESPLEDDPVDARSIDPAALASAADLGERIAQLISALPARQREALVLIAYEHLTTAEAAEVMETTEQNVRTNVHLARQKLKQQLAKVLDDKRGTDSTTAR